MPWGYLSIIIMLLAYIAYHLDITMKMASDVKYVRMQMSGSGMQNKGNMVMEEAVTSESKK